MEKDILEGTVGEVGKYDLEFKGGKLVLTFDAETSVGEGGIVKASSKNKIEIDKGPLLAAIKKIIPGTADDVVIDMLDKYILEAN